MTSAAAKLFHYCQFRVREQDVEQFGYNGIGGGVLREWVRRVWRSRAVPGEADSDLSEFMLGLVRAHFPAQHPFEAVVLVRDELLKPLPIKADLKDRRWRAQWRVEDVQPKEP